MSQVSVLFVCLGNICRSPSAEGVLRARLAQAGLDGIRIDSAGTSPWHVGNPPDTRAQAAASRRGIDISMLRARQVSPADFALFDHIFAMDDDNLAVLLRLAPPAYRSRVRRLLDLMPEQPLRQVPDPYHGDARDFEHMLDLLERAADAFLAELAAAHCEGFGP